MNITIILLAIVFLFFFRKFFTKWMYTPSKHHRLAMILTTGLVVAAGLLANHEWFNIINHVFLTNENTLLYGIILILTAIIFFGIIASIKDSSKSKKVKKGLYFFILSLGVFLVVQTVNPCFSGGRYATRISQACINFKMTATLWHDYVPSFFLIIAGFILLSVACKDFGVLLENKTTETSE